MEVWRMVKFRDVAENIRITIDDVKNSKFDKYIAGEHMDSEDLKLNRCGIIGENYLGPAFNRQFLRGQILYGSRRTYLRKVVVADFDGITSNTTFVIQPKGEELLPGLIPFIMQTESFTEHSIRNSKGSVNPYINWKDIANYEFYIPPKREQKRIKKILLSVEKNFQIKKELLEKIKKYKEKLMKELLTKGIGHTAFKNTEVGEIPVEWSIDKISSYYKVNTGSTPLREKYNEYYLDGIIPWVKTLDLNNKHMYIIEEKITERAIDETHCRVQPKETVLIAMYGGFNQIGRTGVLKIDAATNQAICSLPPNKNIDSDYLNYYLINNRYRWKRVAASSRKDPNITKSDVENFLITVPKIEEQRKITDIMLSVEKTIESIEMHIEDTKRLKKKLLYDLFAPEFYK